MDSSISVNARSVLLLRLMTSGIFIIAGAGHLFDPGKTVLRIEQASFKNVAYFFGDPEVLVVLSGLVMLVAGLLFMIGYKTRWMAMVLIGVLVPITLTVQVGQINTLGPLFKNIAILGSLVFFTMNSFKRVQYIKQKINAN